MKVYLLDETVDVTVNSGNVVIIILDWMSRVLFMFIKFTIISLHDDCKLENVCYL